jgi:hypothetical protein
MIALPGPAGLGSLACTTGHGWCPGSASLSLVEEVFGSMLY